MATLQNNGPISFADIANEFRPGYRGPIDITDYYRDGQFVPGSGAITGVAERQQIRATGTVSNTPNPGADRNQQYQITIGSGFDTSPEEISEAGVVNLPLTFVEGGTPLGNSGVTLGSIPVGVSGSGNDTMGSFDISENSPVASDRAVTIEVSTQTFPSTEVETITESGTWTPRFPGRPFTMYAVGGGGGGGAAIGGIFVDILNLAAVAATGGGAGGVVSRHFPSGLSSAEIEIGTGGTSGGEVTVPGSLDSARDGDDTVVTIGPNDKINASGASRGYGAASQISGDTVLGAWDFLLSSGGDVNISPVGTADLITGPIEASRVGNGASINFPFTIQGVTVDGSGGAGGFRRHGGDGNFPGAGGGGSINTRPGGSALGGNGANGVVYVVYSNTETIVQMRNVSSNWSGRLTLRTSAGSTTLADDPISLTAGQEWTLTSDTLYSLFVANTNSYPVSVNGVAVTANFGLGDLDTHAPAGDYSWSVTGMRTVTNLPTFNLNLDSGGAGVFTSTVSGTFSSSIGATAAASEVRAAIVAEYPSLSVSAVTTDSSSNAVFTIDTGQTTNLNATLACTMGDAIGVECAINPMFIVGNTMQVASTYTVRDYQNREFTSFSHNPSSTAPNNLAYVLGVIRTSITDMTETPVNFNATVSGSSLILSATTNATVPGLWSISSNHGDGTGNIQFGTAARTTQGRNAEPNLNSTIPTTGAIDTDNFYGTRRLTPEERS